MIDTDRQYFGLDFILRSPFFSSIYEVNDTTQNINADDNPRLINILRCQLIDVKYFYNVDVLRLFYIENKSWMRIICTISRVLIRTLIDQVFFAVTVWTFYGEKDLICWGPIADRIY